MVGTLQPLALINLIRHLLKVRRQGFLGITLNRDRLLVRKPFIRDRFAGNQPANAVTRAIDKDPLP